MELLNTISEVELKGKILKAENRISKTKQEILTLKALLNKTLSEETEEGQTYLKHNFLPISQQIRYIRTMYFKTTESSKESAKDVYWQKCKEFKFFPPFEVIVLLDFRLYSYAYSSKSTILELKQKLTQDLDRMENELKNMREFLKIKNKV